MPPRQRRPVDASDSDDSFSPSDDDISEDTSSANEDVFDMNEDEDGSDTDATDVEDVEDQIKLFGGNLHPPEYWRKAVEDMNESEWECQDYSPSTTALLDNVEEQWRLYCEVLDRHPRRCYETLSITLLKNFFDWYLSQKVGKDGRKRSGIKKKSSLATYWKIFRLVFERAMGERIASKLGRSMRTVIGQLAKKHGLNDQARANRIMTIDQLKQHIEETLSTTRKMFGVGEVRLLAVLFVLLVAPAGARRKAITRLRFGDIRVVLARDPDGGPHKLLIRFTPKFTKEYLGAKAQNTYPIPETMFDPSLLLSPHVFLLGILFRHRAFRAPSLTSPDQLKKLDICPGELELPLPLREDLDDTYIFRRAILTTTGYVLSTNEPISEAMMGAWFKRIGELLGLEYPTILYSLRYNAANEFDQSADVSEALRNLVLGHASSEPFRHHYLGREIGADLWGILRGQKPQQALIKQSGSIGHSISKRRPTDLTQEQSASIATHPTIRRLTMALRRLPRGSKAYRDAKREINNEKQRLRRELKQSIIHGWTDNQAVDDIERQLRGDGFTKPAVANTCRPQGPAQKLLVIALTAPLIATLEDQYQRRDNAIDAVSVYCLVQEGCTMRRPRPLSKNSPSTPPSHGSEGSPLYLATLSIYARNTTERPKRCFVCIGQAHSLPPNDPRVDDLIQEFYSSNDLTRHFKRKHLSKMKDHDKTECKVCKMPLEHKMHLQNHAFTTHGTVS
ncbi:C2H2 finger domain-containing protein [Colletotrichum godetiae]|uniref:C2H2 finger domain-containing protein n=1 Tax=Colletotrichum godetiae TaxID=1209918 RepID=A0AAJ0A8L1_9PEZI|nr:C2H2 finger domain-containing protein [Colletotrichum godetiae]KAK1658505.1 C2H2 finger domain-containing protein [Colletotrichum godetiae]